MTSFVLANLSRMNHDEDEAESAGNGSFVIGLACFLVSLVATVPLAALLRASSGML